MKRKIFSILLTLVLVLTLGLVTAAPVGAADPITIASSTMVFQSVSGFTLTDNLDGTYSGMIPMVQDESGPPGDGVPGYDLYAREGATAWFGDLGPVWTSKLIVNHDGWPSWNPDTADWYQYSLRFYEEGGVQKWRVANHSGATEADPWSSGGGSGDVEQGVPMSGTMDWIAKYAAETDAGEYLGPIDPTTHPEIPGGAATKGGGAACWDMDWSWGSEVVPLQYGGFAVAVTGTDPYTVTLTPAAGPATNTNTGVNYGTIQSAIDAATSGDTIIVAAGEYAGAVVDKDVTVSGAEGGASIITSGVPYRADYGSLQTAFRPDVDGVEIRNFTINCSEDLDLAVYARGVDKVTVDFLVINTDGTVQGISNWGGSGWVITNNVITNTVTLGGGGIGIFLGAMPPTKHSESTELRVCTGNLIQLNKISATATAETYSCAGIAVCLDTRYGGYGALDGSEDVSGNQILDNIITSTGVNNAVGIEVGTILGDGELDPLRTDPEAIAAIMAAGAVHDNLVQDNSIDGAETGVYFYNVTGLTVTQNEIVNSTKNGIYVEHGHSGVAVNYNNIYGNAFGFEHEDIPEVDYGSIDATLNWWGATDGPYHLDANPDGSGNAVSDNVNFYPYLGSPYEESGAAVSFIATTEEPVIGIEVSPTFINFGAISAGITATGDTLTVTNTGNMPMSVSADLTEDTFYSESNYFYTRALKLNGKDSDQVGDPTNLGSWPATDLGLKLVDPSPGAGYPYFSHPVTTKLMVPDGITLGATYTGTVVFWAELALD